MTKPDPERLRALLQLPLPTTKSELQIYENTIFNS